MRDQAKSEIILEQYKLYVEIADRLRDRRDRLHAYFIGMNTAAIGILVLTIVGDFGHEPARLWMASILAIPFWCAINLTWYFLLRVHRKTAKLKGDGIHALEVKLPTKPWTDEQHRKSEKWLDSTTVEQLFPWLFGIPYMPILLWPIFMNQLFN